MREKLHACCNLFVRQFVRRFCSGFNELLARMPKEPKAATELRRIRLKAKAGNKVQTRPSEITLTVVGNGSPGSPKCLFLVTDQSRYLFNCGEGTQRLAHEHKMKLAKLENIFFTTKTWENVGGLLGLSLTVQDIGVPELCLHGPSDIEDLYILTKGFMVTENLKISKRKLSEESFSDNCMKVEYIRLKKKSFPPDKAKKLKLESDGDYKQEEAVAYLCKPFSKPGQLQLQKCVQYGVPPGPLLGELKNGRDVTLPNGTVVRSKDVVSPEEPGPVFIVLEVPSENYLEELLSIEKFKPHQRTAICEDDAAKVVVHFTPVSVMRHSLYQEWMERFPVSTYHLCINELSSSLSSVSAHRTQHRLNLVHPEIFPLLQEQNSIATENENFEVNTVIGNTLTRIKLRPNKGLDRDAVVKVETDAYRDEALNSPEFPEKLEELKTTLPCIKSFSDLKFPEVLFLGTGSSVPSKDRNVSGILLTFEDGSSILLDCGEGTTSQLIKFHGFRKAQRILSGLKALFVSHLHADHHLGLIQVLKERSQAIQELSAPWSPLTVIAPRFLPTWIHSYHHKFEPVLHLLRHIDCNALLYDQESHCRKELCSHLNISHMGTVLVKHCKNAFGITLTTMDNWKVVYSGDTMPCDSLVEAGKDCDLLIHEATMEDDLLEEAVIKTHSTTSQAIEVGNRMKAKFIILTHFSQRYAKLPLISDTLQRNVGCAFDYMLLRPADLPVLPYLFPCLQSLFSEHYKEMQEKTEKKLRQKAILNQESVS